MTDEGAADVWEFVAMLGDIPEGEVLGIETVRGERICLVNHRGTVHAVANNCTHQEFAMSDGHLLPKEGRCIIECAWHGAQFDCTSGAVLKPPAEQPLAVYRVKVEGEEIFVGGRVS